MSNKTINVLFTGDILPADSDYTIYNGIGTRISCNKSLWSEEVVKLFRNADVAITNLEGPLVPPEYTTKKISWRGNPDIINSFNELGITHVNIANNHILEHGGKIFNITRKMLEDKGFQVIGYYENDKPVISKFIKNGINFSIIGLNQIHDIYNPKCYVELNRETIKSILCSNEVKESNIIILYFHWGNEYIQIPSWEQISLAKFAIDNGANIIVGHHPHVVQPIERYKDGLICFSLGNFLFDMFWSIYVKTGIILEVKFNNKGIESWKIYETKYNYRYTVLLASNGEIKDKMNKEFLKYQKNVKKGQKHYEKYYRRKLKNKRLISRILMKIELILRWNHLTKASKKMLINNLMKKIS